MAELEDGLNGIIYERVPAELPVGGWWVGGECIACNYEARIPLCHRLDRWYAVPAMHDKSAGLQVVK